MSHFSVLVIGENPEEQLAPFDENIKLPRYVAYTKSQLIEKARKELEEYKNSIYAEFLADKEKYKRENDNLQHIEYLEKIFPEKLMQSDEELYQREIIFYNPKDVGKEGELYSIYNPKSKWDWYSLGGRWNGLITLQNGETVNQAKKKEIANLDTLIPFAILKNGEWFEKGEMVWFGFVNNEKEEEQWVLEVKKLLLDLPEDTLISIYDCHF